MKKLLILLPFLFTSISVQANLIEHDLFMEGDGLLTYVDDLGLEIMDMSMTHYNHLAMREKVATDPTYEGFRFMSSDELLVVFDWFLDIDFINPDVSRMQEYLNEGEQGKIKIFKDLVGSSNSFTTCDSEDGCDATNYGDGSSAISGGHNHLLWNNMFIFNNDNWDYGYQMLVREYTVPEPLSASLLILVLFMFLTRYMTRRDFSESL